MKRILKRILLGAVVLLAITLLLFFVMVAWPLPAPPTPNHTVSPLAITNVSRIDLETDSVLSGQTVVIEKARITEVGSIQLSCLKTLCK